MEGPGTSTLLGEDVHSHATFYIGNPPFIIGILKPCYLGWWVYPPYHRKYNGNNESLDPIAHVFLLLCLTTEIMVHMLFCLSCLQVSTSVFFYGKKIWQTLHKSTQLLLLYRFKKKLGRVWWVENPPYSSGQPDKKPSTLVGGWTNPFQKICSSNWIISPRFGMKIKFIWNHHPVLLPSTPNPPLRWCQMTAFPPQKPGLGTIGLGCT